MSSTSSAGDINFGPQQGWQCPCCGRVYSPNTVMCMYCGGDQQPSPHIPPQPWAGTPYWRETSTTGDDNDYAVWNRSYQNITWCFDQAVQPVDQDDPLKTKYTAADINDIAKRKDKE